MFLFAFFLFISSSPSSLILCPFPFHLPKIRSLNQKGRVKIIPVDSGMGVEEWENKYKWQSKPRLSDFLDDEEDNVIFRRPYPQSSHTSVRQNTLSGFRPATYPEGYDTIDRRRKKKIRDPGGLPSTEAVKIREDTFSSDLALFREKREHVAKMQEEDEQIPSCLRSYKNGLLYKTRMWAKNELDHTLENYVAYKKEQDARMRARFDFDLERPDDVHYFVEPEEDSDIDDIAFIAEEFHQENVRHYKDRYSFSHENHKENSQGVREKKCGKAKIGGWAPEAMLSPVEEPSDEYVDPMDELQCLVETVSEYLAEKEEEISKYNSLPKSSKSRLSIQGGNKTDCIGDDRNSSSTIPGVQAQSDTSSAQGISGVKSVMSSLFTSLTDKVGGGPKQPAPSTHAPSEQPSQPALTKLLSFIPKTNSSAPVAVVSPVETSPENSFSSFPSQQPCNVRTQLYNQEPKAAMRNNAPTITKENVPGVETKPHSAPGNTVLGKLNPFKLFSTGDNGNSAEYKQSTCSEFTCSPSHTQWNEKCVSPGKQTIEGGRNLEKIKSSSQEMHLKQNPDETVYGRHNNLIYNGNMPVPELARPTEQKHSENNGFFGPLKNSLSSLMSHAAPLPPQGAPHLTVYPIFRSTEDPPLEKTTENSSFTSKPKMPFLSSENLSAQQCSKTEGGMRSGFLKFGSSGDVSSSMNTHHPVQSYHNSPSKSSTTFTQDSVLAQDNTERGWFSSIFNPTSSPIGSDQNLTSNQQSQKGKAPSSLQHTSNEKPPVTLHGMRHQTTTQPESQSFLTGLFKGSSADNISHVDSNQTKQAGLLSGFLKFGSAGDLSGSFQQQASRSNQPPRNSNRPPFPHHPPLHQNSSSPEIGGILSGLLKFSSTENTAQNVHPSEAGKQRNVSGHFSGQQQCSYESQSTQPQQKGLLSGVLKFASSTQEIQPQQSSQLCQEGLSHTNNQGPNKRPNGSNITLSEEAGQKDTSKQGFTRQHTVPLQQQPAQKSGIFSGLFKFASADNVSTQQNPSAQQNQITPSKFSHEHTAANQALNGSTQRTAQVSGLLSGLFKSSPENVSQQQPKIPHETQQNKVPNYPTAQKQMEQMEPSSQSVGLSGLLNKLTKSTENTDTTFRTSTAQSVCHKDINYSVTRNTPLQTQSNTYVTQISSQQHAEKEKMVAQQGFLSGLFSKHTTAEHVTSTPKQVERPGQITKHTLSTKITDSRSCVLQNTTLDEGINSYQIIIPDCSNQERSRHALFYTPVSIDAESLDLRTSATFARSLQSQATFSSVSTGNLSQLYYSGSLQSVHPVAYSSGNIDLGFQNHSTSSVMNMQPYIGGSNPSLCEATRQHFEKGQWSPYGSPSYDEYQWIKESVLWQHFQNQSLDYNLEDGQSCVGDLHFCSSSNNNQPVKTSTPWSGAVCDQEQDVSYQFEGARNNDPCAKRKLWNSYEDLRNTEYSHIQEDALNLTTKQSNANYGKWHSFNDGSTYSLNGVSYHEGYYEETAPSLSYSANWENGMDYGVLQRSHTDGIIHQGNFNWNQLIDSNYHLNANSETEDSLYLEDTEWYQQWLALLEQGMWWAADDGDCGYFVYTDHEYIYALLTDAAGEYVYACVPENESWGNTQSLDSFPSAWLHNEMVLVCGFKIPLYNEDELLWLPGQDYSDSQLLNAPMDLSAAYRKGNQIMNLNLEQFSQMFENSFMSQGGGLDLTSYRLNKVRMDPRWPNYLNKDQCNDVIDLSYYNNDNMSPYWNNQDIKTLLAQKVAISLNSTPTANSNQQILYNCYQPSQRRRSSTGVTVKHVDDVTEEEWRQRVHPGEEQHNRQIKTLSSVISSFVGKTSEVEINKSSTMSCDQDKHPKNIFSSGFQSLKSKICKEDSNAVLTPSESVTQIQRPATTHGRTLPTIPTSAQLSHASTQLHTNVQKPRLSRQSTMVQQAAPPTQTSVTVIESKESLTKPVPPGQLLADKPVDVPVDKPPEQPQAGFMNFLKSAVGIEETDSQKSSQTPLNQHSKMSSAASLSGSIPTNKEATGVSNLFGSISSLFSSEPSAPHNQQMKPNVTESLLTSASRPKGLQRQQTMDQSNTYRPDQSQTPNRITSQGFSPMSTIVPAMEQTKPVPPTQQTKQEAGTKASGGLFGFSIGEMLTGSTAASQSGHTPQTPASATGPQEESLGKSILSLFSGSNVQQSAPQTGPFSQAHPSAPQQESLGKSLLSMFGGSSAPQPSSQTKPTVESLKQGAIPLKEPSSTGFLSMFGATTTQQTQTQTGSVLGGIRPGSANSTDSPMKGLFSMFSDPIPPQCQPTTSSPPKVAQSQTQHGEPPSNSTPPSQAQGQPAASVLGGLLGGLSASSESPRKSLFSMFSGPSTPQTPGAGRVAETTTKELSNNISSALNDGLSPLLQTADPSSATSIKDLTTTSVQPSASISHSPVTTTASQISSELSQSKLTLNSNVVNAIPDTNTTVEDMHSFTNIRCNIASMEPISECVTAEKETCAGKAFQDSDNKPTVSGRFSIISGSGTETPSPQVGFNSDGQGKSLLSLFSGPSTHSSAGQTGHSPTGSAPVSSGLKDLPAKGLFSVFGGSSPQPSSQAGGSLLGTMFGGSSPQIPASQTGGSFLGGLFGGSGPQAAAQACPEAGPQTGSSLLGGLFGASPQAAGSAAGGSILGGIFGVSATTMASQTSGSLGKFGEGSTQASFSTNSSSIFGGILGGSSSQTVAVSVPSEVPSKGLLSGFGENVPRASPTATSTEMSNDNTKSGLTSTTSGPIIIPKSPDDSKAASTLVPSYTSSKSEERTGVLQQCDGTVKGLETSLTKPLAKEISCQNAETPSALVKGIQSKESETCASAQEQTIPECMYSQPNQDTMPPKLEKETPEAQSADLAINGQQKPPDLEKTIGDSSSDTLTGFMSSLFKPPAALPEVTQEQQKNSIFGLGGTAPISGTGQTTGSLLGGIFGGSNSQTTAPQTGGSLLDGLFKGTTPQSGPQTTTPITGGSILGGIFGGGSTAKTAGPQSGGSLLSGMFGGSSATAQPSGSLLGGIFGGVTAQPAASQSGTSILGGIGGSLFGTVGQTSKPFEPVSTEAKLTTQTTATTPQLHINESGLSKLAPSSTETGANKIVHTTLLDQIKSDGLKGSSVVSFPENSAATNSFLNTAYDVTHHVDNTEKMSAVEKEVICEKFTVIPEDPDGKQGEISVASDIQQEVNQSPKNALPPQATSLFGFDAGKSIGSLFSPTIPSVLSAPQKDSGSSLFSGFKTLSGSLFKEENSVPGKQEPPSPSLFGTKIGFPWQAEPPKPQAATAVTPQLQRNHTPTSGQTHTVQNLATSAAQRPKLVGSTDNVANPQICISTPEVDPSASLVPREIERLVETYPSAGPSSGVQLDNQSTMDLLNPKRLVNT